MRLRPPDPTPTKTATISQSPTISPPLHEHHRAEHPGFQVNPSLLAICQAIVSNLELPKVLSTVLDLTMRELSAQEGSVLLFDKKTDRLEMLASQGLPAEMTQRGYIPRKGSIAEWVIEHNQPTILDGIVRSEKFSSLGTGRFIISAMCVPLRARGGVLGTINLNRTDPSLGPFHQGDLAAMAILGSQAAISIENSRLYESNLKSERLAAVGQTVAGISHCVKNLLTNVSGGLSLCDLARKKEDWEMHRQAMDILRRSVQRISALTLDMLDYSKERTPCCSRVDLAELTKELVEATRKTAEEKKSEIEVNLSEDARLVFADGNQLYRCLLNLIQNGLDANVAGGKIRILARRDASPEALRRLSRPAPAAIVIQVSDSGPGVDAENVERLFEPFFSTKGSKGTGLGLAVTRKIIQEHGGSLELASKPGQSAVFVIHLPDAAAQDSLSLPPAV